MVPIPTPHLHLGKYQSAQCLESSRRATTPNSTNILKLLVSQYGAGARVRQAQRGPPRSAAAAGRGSSRRPAGQADAHRGEAGGSWAVAGGWGGGFGGDGGVV